MAQEAHFNSNGELDMTHVVSNDGNEGFLESSCSSISPRREAYASPVDLPLSVVKLAELNPNLASGDIYSTLLDKFTNPESAGGISSLVADADLILPSGAFLQSGNAGMDPNLNSASSPKSFLSNKLSNLAMDGSRVPRQNSIADQNNRLCRNIQQLLKLGGSAPLIESTLQNHHFSLASGMKQDSNAPIQMQKKPRIDVNHDVTQEQIVQQLLLRQDIKHLQDHNPHVRALIQHYRQQILDSLSQSCRVRAQQSEQQFRHHLQQQATSPASSRDDSVCSQRLMQYLYNLNNRPQDNNIDFWRKIVADFYAPCAKERWCLSSYQNIGQHALGILSLGAVGKWCCDLCGSRSGKGFEVSFEVLPRLWKIKFESGVLEELLFLDFPQERRLPTGVTLLEYAKAVQQSVYEQCRVVREGKLRVIFRNDLKILSWEFCASHHDEYFLRRLIAPQVNQLMRAAQQYQYVLSEGALEDKVPLENLQATCDMFARAGNQFTKSLELPTVSELGFSKRYVRCLQITEVLNIMKDLMTFSHDHKLGPIESLHAYHHQGSIRQTHGSTKKEDQETSQEGSIHSVLIDGNRSMGRNVGLGSHLNSTGKTGERVVSDSRTGDMELLVANYYQKILRESLLNRRATITKPDQLYLTDTASHRAISSSFLGQQSTTPRIFHNSLPPGLPSPQSSEASCYLQQHMIDKLLQNAHGKQKEQAYCENIENIFSGWPTRPRGTNILNNGPVLGNPTTAALAQASVLGNVRGHAEGSRSTSNSDSLKVAGSNIQIKQEKDMSEFHLP